MPSLFEAETRPLMLFGYKGLPITHVPTERGGNL
jgi:hypothetical protein